MTIAEYIDVIKSTDVPNYFIICSTDTELRLVYLNLFCEAHNCKYRYVESIDFKNRTRVLGKKEVLVLTDYADVLNKPADCFKEYNRPVVYMYTNPKGITKEVEQFYDNRVLVISEITALQAKNILLKKGVEASIVEYLLANVENPTFVRRYGLQMLELCNDLKISQMECFNTYYKEQLRAKDSEDPEPFFKAILTKDMTFVHRYLKQQEGNEFYVYAAIFRWLENLLRFLASNGDYWNTGKLVQAVYSTYQHNNWSGMPYIEVIHLYNKGIKYRDAIKTTERDPIVALEVYVCCIIRSLALHRVI